MGAFSGEIRWVERVSCGDTVIYLRDGTLPSRDFQTEYCHMYALKSCCPPYLFAIDEAHVGTVLLVRRVQRVTNFVIMYGRLEARAH